ncbi:uncharacterized protein [Fopius arisanus]|uniref:MULE transposase domain-containing protein n=1 Tax=Fopius arisanus TaxID=64838 RepID=A0A9R1TM30_9HYME|nr:PREDICTED: uncharacterized protein LOC105272751 [Fopius arisanus]
MGNVNNEAVPLAWALMTRKSQEAYVAVLEYFKDHLTPNIVPTVVCQDYEIGLRNAILYVYPNVQVIHCWFHYTQALFRRIRSKLGPRDLQKLRNWRLAKVFYRKMCAIALLPAADIPAAFRWLVDNTAPDIQAFFADLIQYFQDTWLGRFTPEKLSVYLCRERTNNKIESYHRVLHRRFGQHPRIWQFAAKLKNLQTITRTEVDALDRSIPVRRPTSQENLSRQITIDCLWELYENGSWDLARFFGCANHLSAIFQNVFVITTAHEVHMFVRAAGHNVDTPPPRKAMGAMNAILPNGLYRIPILQIDRQEQNISILICEYNP